MVEPRSAFGFRQRHAGQSKFCGFVKCFPRKPSGFIVLARQWLHFGFGELADTLLQQLLFFG